MLPSEVEQLNLLGAARDLQMLASNEETYRQSIAEGARSPDFSQEVELSAPAVQPSDYPPLDLASAASCARSAKMIYNLPRAQGQRSPALPRQGMHRDFDDVPEGGAMPFSVIVGLEGGTSIVVEVGGLVLRVPILEGDAAVIIASTRHCGDEYLHLNARAFFYFPTSANSQRSADGTHDLLFFEEVSFYYFAPPSYYFARFQLFCSSSIILTFSLSFCSSSIILLVF
jgi:hypothetical protein